MEIHLVRLGVYYTPSQNNYTSSEKKGHARQTGKKDGCCGLLTNLSNKHLPCLVYIVRFCSVRVP